MGTATVRRRHEAEVTTWRFGEEPPEGFTVVTASDGKRSAVKYDGTDVARNHEGHAIAVPEGGALIVHADGTHTSVPAKTIPKPIPQDDGSVTWTTEYADNESGLREALTSAGYDVSSLEDAPDPEPEQEPDNSGSGFFRR